MNETRKDPGTKRHASEKGGCDESNGALGLPEPSSFRARYFPIYKSEYPKVFPLMAMFFFACFNYTLLRDLKDVLSLHKMSGYVPVLYLRIFIVLPGTIAVMLLYTKLMTIWEKKTVFYATLSSFIVFFFIFGFILVPLKENIQPVEGWSNTVVLSSEAIRPLILLIEHWTVSTFYVVSELWGTTVVSMMVWAFANDICSVEEAKRIYPVINMGACFSVILSGLTTIMVGNLTSSNGNSDQPIFIIISLVIFNAFVMVYLYYWMQRHVVARRHSEPTHNNGAKPKSKVKLGFTESFRIVFTSRYLLLIAAMVIFHVFSTTFMAAFFKEGFNAYFKRDMHAKMMFMGYFSITNGILTFQLLFWVGGRAIRRFGWTRTALVTPFMLLLIGLPFMANEMVRKYTSTDAASASRLPTVILGFAAISIGKSTKYTFFDVTKEMAFIPVDEGIRSQGKAAVDMVGLRFGQSAASLLQVLLLAMFNSKHVDSYLDVAVCLYTLGITIWIAAVFRLGREFKAKTEDDVNGDEVEEMK